jgi:hypothetical protein
MKWLPVFLVVVATAAVAIGAEAQSRWRLAAGVGPYRVDDIAGTPIVPSATLSREVGRGFLVGGTLGWVRDAGFYGLDALTFDFSVGVRRGSGPFEWTGTIGPAVLLGGDGDGSVYAAGGGQTTMTLTRWVGPRFGIVVGGTGRLWFSTGNSRFSPSASAGIVLRL